MPRQYLMSFEGGRQFRWRKMYKGRVYRVTCEELGVNNWTKEGSWREANEWWRKKLEEIEGRLHKSVQSLADRAANMIHLHGQRALLAAKIDVMREVDQFPEGAKKTVIDAINKVHVLAIPRTPDNMTAQAQAKRFLDLASLRGKALGTTDDLRYYLNRLLTDSGPILRPEMDCGLITESTVSDVYSWLRRSSHAPIVQRKIFGFFRRFVRFLWEEAVIALPRNLDSRVFQFPQPHKTIKVYPVEEVRALLGGLPDRVRLYALLALNCGMYGKDMAFLTHDSYAAGRITYKREKTKRQSGVPTVCYLLWDETNRLVGLYPSTHPTLLLTSKTGTPLYTESIDENGKRKKKDLVQQQYQRGRGNGRATSPEIDLKELRSISATMLESHPIYGRYKSHFLGHSPKSVADKHYAAPSQALFDEALVWLGKQLLD